MSTVLKLTQLLSSVALRLTLLSVFPLASSARYSSTGTAKHLPATISACRGASASCPMPENGEPAIGYGLKKEAEKGTAGASNEMPNRSTALRTYCGSPVRATTTDVLPRQIEPVKGTSAAGVIANWVAPLQKRNLHEGAQAVAQASRREARSSGRDFCIVWGGARFVAGCGVG